MDHVGSTVYNNPVVSVDHVGSTVYNNPEVCVDHVGSTVYAERIKEQFQLQLLIICSSESVLEY